MFPSNIHKNLLQLDREITVLEIECKNMEMDKKKKSGVQCIKKTRPVRNKIKSPLIKEIAKKDIETTKSQQLSPAPSSRVYSTSSQPSNSIKQCNRVCEPFNSNKISQQFGNNSNVHLCTCHSHINSHSSCNSLKQNGCLNCGGGNLFPSNKSDSIIHKEVLFSNSGSSIEVTVMKKQNVDPQKENEIPVRDREEHVCTCQAKSNKKSTGQKWSEILTLEPSKQKEEIYISSKKPINLDDVTSPVGTVEKSHGKEPFSEAYNRIIEGIKEANTKPLYNQTLKKCLSENENDDIQLRLFHIFKKLNKKVGTQDPQTPVAGVKNDESKIFLKSQTHILQTIQKLCDNLISEKDFLSKEVIAKNNLISELKSREEEYLSLNSVLKLNLMKAKERVENNLSTAKELECLKQKLLERSKIYETLKKNNVELKGALNKCVLENDRLKTEIKIYKLELQKFDVLMAGKEAEIKKYKEEIGNFQRQISDHLTSIKTNAQAFDMKKLMEAIIQQCQLVIQDDLDSVTLNENTRDSSKPKALMHSSPTSTKTSEVNSSWDQISSIRVHEQQITEDDDKAFHQIYGDDVSYEATSAKHTSKKQNKMPADQVEEKNLPRFVSWLSLVNEESLTSTPKTKKSPSKISGTPKADRNSNSLAQQNHKPTIDELVKRVKQKWTEEVYTGSHYNDTIKDFLNESEVSQISE